MSRKRRPPSTIKAFVAIRVRWPQRPVEIKSLADCTCYFDWGHIPKALFARELAHEIDDEKVSYEQIHHVYWRAKYDLFEEYAFTVSIVKRGEPFAIPVTCYGSDCDVLF